MPWGALIGLAGTIASGVMSAVNNRKIQAQQDAEARRQQAYYEAKANENPLTRADNQAMLREYDRNAAEKARSAQNVAAITGATPEYALAQQKQLAEGRVNLMSNMAANNQQRVDKMLELAESSRQNQAKNRIDMLNANNNSYAALAANAGNAMSGIDFSNWDKKKKTTSIG